jgi:CubicO group peptidase (beta-lactamase class C family)
MSNIGNSQILEAVNAQIHKKDGLTTEQFQLEYEKVKTFPNNAEISIAIVSNSEAKYFGIRRKNDSILSIKNYNKIFETGSITKVFTAALLANFVNEEKIELDDYINDYIDFTIKDNVKISFKQLATHTSGLPRLPEILSSPTLSLENPYKDFGVEELKMDLSEKLVMLDEPGAKSEYSNLGVGLLGYVLSEIGNSTYEDLLQSKIFEKYHMFNSTTIRSSVMDKLVLGRNEKGEVVSNWDMSILMGAGGILSTAEDLTKFAIAHFDDFNSDLKMTRTPFHQVTENFSTGLAWGIVKSESGAKWYWHNGGTGGYTSSMIIDTEKENSVIVLSNLTALGEMANNVMNLCPELMKTLE